MNHLSLESHAGALHICDEDRRCLRQHQERPRWYRRSLVEEFVDGVTADRNPPVTGEETLKVHRPNDAVLASNEAGCPVKVERS